MRCPVPNATHATAGSTLILSGGLTCLIIGGAENILIVLWCGVALLLIGFIMLYAALKRCSKQLQLERDLHLERALQLGLELQLEHERQLNLEREQELHNVEPVIIIVYINNPITTPDNDVCDFYRIQATTI